jgi:GTP-binding protein Era
MQDLHTESDKPDFHSGFVAIIGRPNVGKSTLINALLGQKVAAVSPRPQTTRRRQLGILTRPNAQLIFVDTPGVHQARHKLGEFMNEEAEGSLEGADSILWLVDLTSDPTEDDMHIAGLLGSPRRKPGLLVAGNKSDLVAEGRAIEQLQKYLALLPGGAESILISAARGDGLEHLVELLAALCPVGSAEYDDDQITDLYEREIAADLIREAALLKLREEVPHGLGVRMDEYKERENGLDYIRATLLIERDSQKPIVIGVGGKMLKQIGTEARRQIETMTGRRAYLELRVKVEKGWRNRESVLEQLGYKSRR